MNELIAFMQTETGREMLSGLILIGVLWALR